MSRLLRVMRGTRSKLHRQNVSEGGGVVPPSTSYRGWFVFVYVSMDIALWHEQKEAVQSLIDRGIIAGIPVFNPEKAVKNETVSGR